MDIGILRTRQGGRSRSYGEEGEEEGEEARSTRSGLVSIHEGHERVVAKIVQVALPNTGVGGVGTVRIRPSRSHARMVVRIRWNRGLSCLRNHRVRNPR